MPDTKGPDPQTAALHAAARAAMARFHDRLRFPHAAAWPLATALPVLPALLVAALGALVPAPPLPGDAPAPGPADPLALHAADLRFAVALGLLLIALVLAFFGQRHVLMAHAAPFWPRRAATGGGLAADPVAFAAAPPAGPRLRAGAWLALGLVYGIVLVTQANRVLPWLDPPALPLSPNALSAMPADAAWPLLLGAGVIALMFAVVALSAYAIHVTWHNYPAVRHAAALAAALEAALARKAAAEAAAVKTRVATGTPSAPGLPALIAEAWETDPGRAGGMLPVETGLAPSQIVAILDTFVRPLVLVLILGLVTLALFLDRLELRHGWPAAVQSTHDLWIVVLGVLCSGMVAAVYFPAVARLSLYLEAEEDLRPGGGGGAGWRIARGEGAEAGQRLILPRKAPAPPDYDPALAGYLGADRAKMRILLHSRHFAGGFHLLLKQPVAQQAQTVLGLLAPTAAGALLNLL